MGIGQLDILYDLSPGINREAVRLAREEAKCLLTTEHWRPLREALASLPPIESEHAVLNAAVVELGLSLNCPPEVLAQVEEIVQLLIPWRKGPFRLFGLDIESEWRSNLKWDRLAPFLGDVEGKRVADVGCNNGYYMFRMLEHDPRCVIGFDPSDRFYYQFQFLNSILGEKRLHYEMMGVEMLSALPNAFDVILCLGVLYHRRDPLGALRALRDALSPGGQLILESQAVDIEGPYALFPLERYAKARNVYFVPSAECLCHWVERAGFVDVEVFSAEPTRLDEQRRTPHAPWESLEDFLDPEDHSKTIEGYPAPFRVALRARKPG